MFVNVFHVAVVFLYVTFCIGSKENAKRICFDEKCSEPLSLAYTLLGYNGDRGDKLSFKAKDKVIVYSKPLLGEGDEWFVEINGKKGYVKSTFLKETKLFKRPDEYLNANSLEEVTNPTEESENKVNINLLGENTDIETKAEAETLSKQVTPQYSADVKKINPTVKVISDFNKTITDQQTKVEYDDGNETAAEEEDGEETDGEELSDDEEGVESEDDNNIIHAKLDTHQKISNTAKTNSVGDSIKNLKPTGETKLSQQVENVINSTIVKKNDINGTPDDSNTEKTIKQPISSADPNQPPPIKKDIVGLDANEPIPTKAIDSENNINLNEHPQIKKDIFETVPSELPLTIKNDLKVDTNEQPPIKTDISVEKSSSISLSESNPQTLSALDIKQDGTAFNISLGNSINDSVPIHPNKQDTEIDGSTMFSTITVDEKLLPNMDLNNKASQTAEAQVTLLPTMSDSRNQIPSTNNVVQNEDTLSQPLPSTIDQKTLLEVNHDSFLPNLNMPKIQSDHKSPETIHQATIVVPNESEIIDKPLQEVIQNSSIPNHVSNDDTQGDFNITENIYQATTEVPVVYEESTILHPSVSEITPENVESLKRPDFYKPYQNPGPNVNNIELISNLKPDDEILPSANDDSTSSSTLNDVHDDKLNQELNANYPTQDSLSLNANAFESTDSIWHHSFIDTITNYLSFQNISSLLISATSFYAIDSRNMIGFDLIENQLVFGLSARMVLFILIVSASVLTFTLGYYFLDIRRQDGKLVAMVNSLQKDLLCYTKECDMLKDELTSTKEKLSGIEDSSFGTDEMVISLRQDIQKRNIKIGDLEAELEKTVKELQSTTRAAEQLQSFIDEVLQWKDETKIEEDMAGIEQLQEENNKINEELEILKKDLQKAKEDLILIEKLYEDECVSSKIQQHEIDSLKETLQAMQGSDFSNESLSSIINQSEIRAQLRNALEERDLLATQLQTEKSSLSVLESELKTTIDSLQKAEQSSTRLEVLCDHFKKRESDLVKEINSKESLWLSMQGETMTTIEKMQAFQVEVQQYKEMCVELRRELAEAEVSRRSDQAELEKRAHTAWLEARKAQREAEAHRAEAAALRRRLAVPQTNSAPPAAALSPSLPLLPPPLPPPLLPPPPMQMRPPPLGRHPSPPYSPSSTVLANSPPPRYSDYISSRDYPERRGRSPYSPSRRSHHRRRSFSNERYYEDDRRPSRGSHHNHMTETETDYSPPPSPRRRRSLRSPRHGPSSGSGQSSDSDK